MDISEYTNRISVQVRGEDVRDAFVGACKDIAAISPPDVMESDFKKLLAVDGNGKWVAAKIEEVERYARLLSQWALSITTNKEETEVIAMFMSYYTGNARIRTLDIYHVVSGEMYILQLGSVVGSYLFGGIWETDVTKLDTDAEEYAAQRVLDGYDTATKTWYTPKAGDRVVFTASVDGYVVFFDGLGGTDGVSKEEPTIRLFRFMKGAERWLI